MFDEIKNKLFIRKIIIIGKNMHKKSNKILFILIFSLMTAASFILLAERIFCYNCGFAVRPGSKYIILQGKNFCSQECANKYLESKLPKCAVCKKPIKGDYFTKDGKSYCSQECLSTTFPRCTICGKPSANGSFFNGDKRNFVCAECAKLPRCSSCLNPCKDPKILDDSRPLCQQCAKTAVYDQAEADKIFQKVRNILKKKLEIYTDTDLQFSLGDDKALKSCTNSYHTTGQEQGVFVFQSCIEQTVTPEGKVVKTVVKEQSSSIIALYGLARDKMGEVIAHEIAHDWMQVNYPKITDLKTKEGWAEFVASRFNDVIGKSDANARMEFNPNPIYGDGYRLFRDLYKKGGTRAIILYLDKQPK